MEPTTANGARLQACTPFSASVQHRPVRSLVPNRDLPVGKARVRRTFRPGFVLDDNVVGEAVERPGGRRFVFIHPDRMAQVVKAHRERPLAVAAFLHGVAVHELTHIDGKMGDGHDEEFIARREDLGAATAHLLPAISVLVAKLLKIGERESEEGRRVARLERELEKARAMVKGQRARIVEMERGAAPDADGGHAAGPSNLREWLDAWDELHRRRISGARIVAARRHVEALLEGIVEAAGVAELDELEGVLASANVTPPRGQREGHHTTRLRDAIDRGRVRARGRGRVDPERLLEVAVAALRARPPVGVEVGYVEGFVARNREVLLGIVRGAFAS